MINLLLISISKAEIGTHCTWCNNASGLDPCLNELSAGWTLVRAIGPSRNTWYPETDQLDGIAPANDNGVSLYNAGQFEDFVAGWNQFLFASGDCATYLITSKNEAIGENYENSDRWICKSSGYGQIGGAKPYQAKWYHRSFMNEDPILSTIDHIDAQNNDQYLYGGNSWARYAPNTGGHAVFIKKSDNLDSHGCEPQGCNLIDIDSYLTDCSFEFPDAKTSIGTNTGTITVNSNNIATNTGDISGLDTRVQSVEDAVATLQQQVIGIGNAVTQHQSVSIFDINSNPNALLILFLSFMNVICLVVICVLISKLNRKQNYSRVKSYVETDSENRMINTY